MKILLATFKIKRQEFTVYRSNIYLNFLFGCLPLFLSILLWKAIYGISQKFIGGYTYKEMITYYILVFLLSSILNVRENTVHIAEIIQNGEIHNYMLKPVSFFSLDFKLYLAEKLVYFSNIAIPFITFCILIRKNITLNLEYFIYFIISVCLAFVLKYIIGSIFGILTIWIEDITGLLDFWNNIENFLSGGILPLSILPSSMYTVISFLPFKYFLFVPIDIYMGKIKVMKIIETFAIQLWWIFFLGLFLNILKLKAYKKYSGYGT